MKIRRIVYVLGLMVLVTGLCTMTYAKQEEKEGKEKKEKKDKKEQVVEKSQVPTEVLAAIEKQAAWAEIKKIKLETKGEEKFYEVKTVKDGKKSEFIVSADGKTVKVEEDEEKEECKEEKGKEEKIELTAAPAPVQAAVQKAIGTGKLTSLTSEKEDGVMMYEAEYETAGMKNSIVVDAAGSLIEKEEGVSVDSLPAAVKAAVEKEFPQGKIGEVVVVNKPIYEVTVQIDGKDKEVKVSPSGEIEKKHKHEGKEGKEGKSCDKKGEKHDKEDEEDDDD